MLSTGRYGLLFGIVLLVMSILGIEGAEQVYPAALIMGGISFVVGLVSRIAYVFSKEDEMSV